MKYSEKTKERLKNYKTKMFPNLSDGIWKNNKQFYPHILPEINKHDNLLKPYKNEIISYIDNCRIKLHSNFHHLNSSQALCLNFFFPLLQEKRLEIITNLLQFSNETVNYNKLNFEKDGVEVKHGRVSTKFDFYFETISGKKIYFEIKYTEEGFGKAKINETKFEEVYTKYLNPIAENLHDLKQFYNNYQILRNLIHIDENSYVIFIYPKDNIRIKKDAERVKTDFLRPLFKDHFYSLTWEECFEKVSGSILDSRLKSQLNDFKEKYIPD